MRRIPVLVSVLAALACSGLGTQPNPEAVRSVVEALDGASPDITGRLLLAGLAEAETGLVPAACSEALDQVASASPDARSLFVSTALFEACPRACGLTDDEARELGSLDRAERTKLAIRVCSDDGDDPLGGNLADKRAQMDAGDYLMARLLIDPALAALEEDPEAQADLRGLLPRAVAGLAVVEVDPARWPEDPIDVARTTGINVTEAEKKLRILIPGIRECGTRGGTPRESDHPPGRAVLSLVTDEDGRIRTTHFALSSLSPEQEDCLLELMRGQDLPEPTGGPVVADLYVDLTR